MHWGTGARGHTTTAAKHMSAIAAHCTPPWRARFFSPVNVREHAGVKGPLAVSPYRKAGEHRHARARHVHRHLQLLLEARNKNETNLLCHYSCNRSIGSTCTNREFVKFIIHLCIGVGARAARRVKEIGSKKAYVIRSWRGRRRRLIAGVFQHAKNAGFCHVTQTSEQLDCGGSCTVRLWGATWEVGVSVQARIFLFVSRSRSRRRLTPPPPHI